MATSDDALVQWLYNEVGNREAAWARARAAGRKTDPVAEAFRAGWAAAMRQRDAAGEQVGLPLGERPVGPAWTPASGTEDATRETSLQAAAEIAGPRAADLRRRVFEALVAAPDSDEGVARRLGLAENTVRPRRVELRDRGLVRADGQVTTAAGRRAVRWAAVTSAREPSG